MARKNFFTFFGFKVKMSWNEVIFATKCLLPSIYQYNPDIFIGVGVGGAIWGALLAGSLYDKSFLTVDRKVIRHNNERDVELIGANSVTHNAELIRGKRVVLVSAEMISGKTVRILRDLVVQSQPSSIKIATLDYNSNSDPLPDSGFRYVCSAWITQKPWRRVPTYLNPDEPIRT